MDSVEATTFRPKNPIEHAAKISCHGCEGTAADGCNCLCDGTILYKMRAAVHRLLVIGADTTRSTHSRAESRRLARARLQVLADQADQAEREATAFMAFRDELPEHDVAIVDYIAYDNLIGNQMPWHSLQATAVAFKRTVTEVKELRDRCLLALREWPFSDVTEDAALARRAA